MVHFGDIQQAHQRIQSMIHRTPVITSTTLNQQINGQIFLKCENFQKVGAFKFRGVSNTLRQLSSTQKSRGVVTHSSGNHAQAVAKAAAILQINATVVMPENAPRVKAIATKDYGATIVPCDSSVSAREATCQELIDQYGYTLVHPYDDDRIIAGAGTAALELMEDAGALDYLFCPIGGGGLCSGSAIAAKGFSKHTQVIGVEPEKADDAYRSLRDQTLYPSDYPNTIADGLRTSLSPRTFQLIKSNVDRIVRVSDDEIVSAMALLWNRMKLVVEPSGATSLAGLLKIGSTLGADRLGAILSGGNVDFTAFFKQLYA